MSVVEMAGFGDIPYQSPKCGWVKSMRLLPGGYVRVVCKKESTGELYYDYALIGSIQKRVELYGKCVALRLLNSFKYPIEFLQGDVLINERWYVKIYKSHHEMDLHSRVTSRFDLSSPELLVTWVERGLNE